MAPLKIEGLALGMKLLTEVDGYVHVVKLMVRFGSPKNYSPRVPKKGAEF